MNLTLLIAAAGSFMVFFVPPVIGLILYIAILAWYPSYLSLQIGTIDFTVCRIIILAIYANLFFCTDLPKHYKPILLDKLLILYFIAQVIAGVSNTPALILLENRAGAIFDMLLPYFAVRIIITGKKQYLTLIKGILFSAVPFAILGIYQCYTGANIFGFIPGHTYIAKPRHGMYRALLTFSVSIMFGLYFAMLAPPCAALFHSVNKNKKLYGFAILIMLIGVLSSMSSGPMLSALLSIMFILAYKYRKNWKLAVIAVIIFFGSIEIISNRHFYDVFGRFTFDNRTAWYRSKLIDVALFEGGMKSHWLTGFGLNDPGWSDRIDKRGHTDLVNHYLLILSRYGIVGLLPFMAIITVALKMLHRAFQSAMLDSDRWLIWCLAAALFGLLTSLTTVSLFGPPKTILYLLFAFCSITPLIVKQANYNILLHTQLISKMTDSNYSILPSS